MKVELELLKAIYAAEPMQTAAMRIEGERIYRTNVGSRRYYSRKNDESLYLSLTSFLDGTKTAKSDAHLSSWRVEMALELGSSDAASGYVDATAEYGTCLHILIANFCKAGRLSPVGVELAALEHFRELGWGKKTLQAATNEIVSDFAAIVQFFYDYEVVVLAVELPVFGCLSASVDEFGNAPKIATCIDLVVEMNAKHYEKTAKENRKRIRSIINLKSGEYVADAHGLQLAGEMLLFNNCFSDLVGEIEYVYNLAPNKWRDVPTYKLTNQTSTHNVKRFLHKIEGGLLEGVFAQPKKKVNIFIGDFVLGENPTDLLNHNPLAQYILEQANNQQEHESKKA